LSVPSDPGKDRSRTSPIEERSGIPVLYDSTKSLLQSILRSLETVDEAGWDDQTESGNSCLYEMHQMSGSLYTPYKPDKLNANSRAQNDLPEKLTRAIPHVRTMVIAIRHKDQTRALESGKAALAEMNGASRSMPSGFGAGPRTEAREAVPRSAKPAEKHGLLPAGMARSRKASRQVLASSGM
jgi:hypothetical protein